MSESRSLYERVGGENTITKLVDEFYNRVLNEDSLTAIFKNADMDALRRMQREFFAAALGRPIVYAGRGLREAHAGRGINKEHFRRFIDHMMETLKGYEISDQDNYEIISRLNKYADEITGDTTVEG